MLKINNKRGETQILHPTRAFSTQRGLTKSRNLLKNTQRSLKMEEEEWLYVWKEDGVCFWSYNGVRIGWRESVEVFFNIMGSKLHNCPCSQGEGNGLTRAKNRNPTNMPGLGCESRLGASHNTTIAWGLPLESLLLLLYGFVLFILP